MALARRHVGGHLIAYDQATSRRLARFGHEASGPELVVRRFLYSTGLRFRVNNRDLAGSPDIANRAKKWAVFVHGCYWHHHAGCSRATVPSRNRLFWLAKFRENRRRDRRVVIQLQEAGFTVAVVWECETVKSLTLRQKLAKFIRTARRQGN